MDFGASQTCEGVFSSIDPNRLANLAEGAEITEDSTHAQELVNVKKSHEVIEKKNPTVFHPLFLLRFPYLVNKISK